MVDLIVEDDSSADGSDGKNEGWTEGDAQALRDASSALSRLLTRAEERGIRKSKRIAQFLAAVGDSKIVVWPARDLREDEVAISDDMLLCLNALRWQRPALMSLIPDGDQRVSRLIELWRSSRGSASDA